MTVLARAAVDDFIQKPEYRSERIHCCTDFPGALPARGRHPYDRRGFLFAVLDSELFCASASYEVNSRDVPGVIHYVSF
jgi:hypothetical protein